jgi:DNA-binding NtrC family response regulator
VRELQHAVERAVILSTDMTLPAHLFAAVKTELRPGAEHAMSRRMPSGGGEGAGTHTLVVPTLDLMDIEHHAIEHALMLSNGNRTRAAALLGIDVRTLRRKLNGSRRPSAATTETEQAAPTAADDLPEPVRAPDWSLTQPDKMPQDK